MPRPTSSTTVVRPDLADALFQHVELPFIGTRIFPIFDTVQKSGGYPVIPTEALLKMPANLKRAPRAKYARGDWEFERGTYACEEYGFEEPVDDSEANAYAHYFDAEMVSGEIARNTLLRAQEKRILDILQDTGTFTPTAITHEWDDGENATPIDDVNARKLAIYQATGVKANALIIAYSTFLDLGVCDQIVDRIKYTNPSVQRGEIPANLLAQAFGLEEVIVADQVYDSEAEGQDTTISTLWSNEYAMVCRVARGPNLRQPCIGRTFLWTADSPENATVESYREDPSRSDIIRVRQHTDEVTVMTACANLLSNITT